MGWEEKDDLSLETHLSRLIEKQQELQPKLRLLEIAINNIREIQTKVQTVRINDKGQNDIKIIKINPKNRWGDELTDKFRLDTKLKCFEKTRELLGELNDK